MQVVQLCEKKRTPQPKYILVDTPGQIEIFTWSASGAIITEAFASTFPTMVAYVVDTARSAAPQTFMSNMLQARSRNHRAVLVPLAQNEQQAVSQDYDRYRCDASDQPPRKALCFVRQPGLCVAICAECCC